jgi:GNAT superfamily N-acetyltransferase
MLTNSDDVPILERDETVPFCWPSDSAALREFAVDSYSTEVIEDRVAFEKMQESIGWHVTEDQWQVLSKELVEDSMVLITQFDQPVAIACGLSRDNNWVELAWVAVIPCHRGLGIGKMVCAAVVRQLLALGKSKIFGSTQDERLSAIKIYLDLGFYPLYRKRKIERWEAICAKLAKPFTPSLWGWPIHAK